ncbi:MAG: very short patch repair endonuclease [Betaproteobacteria bacterium]|nr:very short patch repair endonuclease [Betaproteobacteria bacterium]
MDRVTPTQRSRMMAAVGPKNTAPELFVRRRLHAAGYRYRLHVEMLPGKPDIVLHRFRLAIFVNGCFWHGHNCQRGKRPASNASFWNAKLDKNIKRDRRIKRELHALGWSYITIRECRLAEGTSFRCWVTNTHSTSPKNATVRSASTPARFADVAARGAASTVLALAENLPKIVDSSSVSDDAE